MEEVYLTTQSAAGVQLRIEALVREYQTKLARYLRRMVGDSELALDLTQDVFLAAFRTLSRDPDRPLTAGGSIRRRPTVRSRTCGDARSSAALPLDRESDDRSWRIDERSASSVDLQAAIAKLPPDQAAAVLLTSYAGYSSNEAATILGTSPDAVRQRVCRAMKILRSVMTEQL